MERAPRRRNWGLEPDSKTVLDSLMKAHAGGTFMLQEQSGSCLQQMPQHGHLLRTEELQSCL